MNQTQPYGYYCGNEADQYSFYRLPKALFTNERYKNLSDGAKILYGLMLDRMSLSIKNNWLDEQNRVYIIFTLEDVQEYLNCQHGKAVKMLAELDTEKGVGLIKRIKQGQGKPTIIYVLKFCEAQELQISEKENCRLPKNGNHDCRKSATNNTEYNNTEFSYTEYNDPSLPFPSTMEQEEISETDGTEAKSMKSFEAYREIIKNNIEYPILSERYQHDRNIIDGIVDLMVETVCTARKTIRIAGDDYPAGLVKYKFMNLNSGHIEFVLNCLKKNTTEIRSIKKYLLAMLFNAPSTIDTYYTAQVAHDMASNNYYAETG